MGRCFPSVAHKALCFPTKILFLVLLFFCKGFEGYATTWTTCTVGDITVLTNWKNGTVTPTSFTQPGDTWTVNLVMTLVSSETWTVGTAASAPVTVTFATGGGLNTLGTGGTATINIYGDLMVRSGTLSLGGTGNTENINIFGNTIMSAGLFTVCGIGNVENINVYGDMTVSSGTISSVGTKSFFTINTYGNYSMSGGSANTGASTNGTLTMNINGNFNMTGGVYDAAGLNGVITNNIYGNCSFSGMAAMKNSGAGCTSIVHLALPAASGKMLTDNTSTGVWTGTDIVVDTGCTAQLDRDFSTTTDTAATGVYGLTVYGRLICPAAWAANGKGIFILSPRSTLEVASATGINGNITTTGTKTFSASANYVFNGPATQVTGTLMPAVLTAPDTITINNSAGVALINTTSTTGTLLFTNGILYTGANSITVPGGPAGLVGAGATSYVDGTLIKTIAGSSTVNFEVGNMDYAPMHLTLSSSGTGGSFGVKVLHGPHLSVGTSGILTSNIENHYWAISNFGATGPVWVIPKVTYNAGDITGGSNASFVTQEYAGGAWLGSPLATTNTSVPYTSVPVAGIPLGTLAGDYIFGNACGTPITGTTSLCAGSTIPLSDATPGGTWSSSNTAVATVSATGVVTGVATGPVIIFYKTSGCSISVVVNVGTLPITGATTVCAGSAISLSDATPGGTWSSSNTAVATVSATGVVTGISPGTVSISYTSGLCPPVGLAVTVSSLPGITGIATVCSGLTTTLSNAIPGGAWSSSNSAVAAVSGGGIVSGVSMGVANISYKAGSCSVGVAVPVIRISPIAGSSSVCAGDTITLSDATSGGVWSSNNTQVATVSGTGNVTGAGAGSAEISYTAGGCSSNIPITVYPTGAGTITGKDSVCPGSGNTITLSDSVSCSCGGWSSTNTSLATIAVTGVVTGVSPGVDTIKYINTNGCGIFTSRFVIYVRTIKECTEGIFQTDQLTELKIFPNPNQGIFTMNLLSDIDEELHIVITNVTGEKIKEIITTTNKTINIKLDSPAGIYLLSASTMHGRYFAKIAEVPAP